MEMTREQLIQALRRNARKNKINFQVDTKKGKGSHYRVRLGERVTTVQSGDLSPFQVRRICEQLGVDPAAV
jgi:hypothetical protein